MTGYFNNPRLRIIYFSKNFRSTTGQPVTSLRAYSTALLPLVHRLFNTSSISHFRGFFNCYSTVNYNKTFMDPWLWLNKNDK